jgi:hypothetical protein
LDRRVISRRWATADWSRFGDSNTSGTEKNGSDDYKEAVTTRHLFVKACCRTELLMRAEPSPAENVVTCRTHLARVRRRTLQAQILSQRYPTRPVATPLVENHLPPSSIVNLRVHGATLQRAPRDLSRRVQPTRLRRSEFPQLGASRGPFRSGWICCSAPRAQNRRIGNSESSSGPCFVLRVSRRAECYYRSRSWVQRKQRRRS